MIVRMIHCSKEETEALFAKPAARPLETRGREMKGPKEKK